MSRSSRTTDGEERSLDAEVVIAGGGLAGAAAATLLAKAGRRVVLLERSTGPHDKVCGEFLSAEALDYLNRLGVSAAGLGALPITGVRVAGKGRATQTALPFTAMSLTRRCLDEALLRTAVDAGATVLRGEAVHSLQRTSTGWLARVGSGGSVCAPAAFLATGKHDLLGFNRPSGPQGDLLALKMYWRLAPGQASALGKHVELLLYRDGYAGLQPVEGGAANLCCLVRRTRFRELGGDWQALLAAMREQCPHLAVRLDGATPLLAQPLAASAIPYGWVRTRAAAADLWSVGDQAAVIPSFTGDGMSIALHSAFYAVSAYLGGDSAENAQERLAHSLKRQVAFATAVSKGMVRLPALASFAQVWPGVLRLLAAGTRVPARHRIA